MFWRFLYLYWIFAYECSSFYTKNFIRRWILGRPTIDRVKLVKEITHRLETFNIVYVKVFQSLCLEQGVLSEREKDYLMRYTDNVPYHADEIDLNTLDYLQENYGISVDNRRPVNSGIVGVVFKGVKRDNNKTDDKRDDNKDNKYDKSEDLETRVVVKMLKRGIVERYNQAYNELETIAKYMAYIPYINHIDYSKMIGDSKQSILDQTDFTKERDNILLFNEKYRFNKEFILPKVYPEITDALNSVIVMTDITGLRFRDIKDYDDDVKYRFATLLQKFGFLSILYHSCIQGDFHAGNVFFYDNSKNSDLEKESKPRYQLGVIDFGLCYFPSPENQSGYHTFFYDIQVKEDYSKITNVLPVLIDNKSKYYNFSSHKKSMIVGELEDCIKRYAKKNMDVNFILNLGRIFRSYGLKFTREFNNICMSLQVTNSLGLSLSPEVHKIHCELMNEMTQIDRLLEIED